MCLSCFGFTLIALNVSLLVDEFRDFVWSSLLAVDTDVARQI